MLYMHGLKTQPDDDCTEHQMLGYCHAEGVDKEQAVQRLHVRRHHQLCGYSGFTPEDTSQHNPTTQRLATGRWMMTYSTAQHSTAPTMVCTKVRSRSAQCQLPQHTFESVSSGGKAIKSCLPSVACYTCATDAGGQKCQGTTVGISCVGCSIQVAEGVLQNAAMTHLVDIALNEL